MKHLSRNSLSFIALAAVAAIVLTAVIAIGSNTDKKAISVEAIAKIPHKLPAYTQGLEFYGAHLLESTGQYGKSQLRLVDPTTGEVISEGRLPNHYFGEGVTVVDGTAYQLSWKAGQLFVTNLANSPLVPVKSYTYDGEGWGLCATDRFFRSNGSDTLEVHQLKDFKRIDSLQVRYDGKPLDKLNELECALGYIWANVYQTDFIYKIKPSTGEALAKYDLSGLVPEEHKGSDEFVLNGIAYDPGQRTFIVTGKQWPVMYRVEFP